MSLKPDASWAEHIRLREPSRVILSSDRTWELDRALPTDDVSPDFITEAASKALDDLLDQSMQRMVALDWTTTQVRMLDRPGNTTLMVVQVDVLR